MNLPRTMPTSPGADEHAPYFSAVLSPRDVLEMRLEIEAAGVDADALSEYERLQEERFRVARESMMRAVRMEADRKNEARQRAAKLETDVECLRINRDVWRFIAVLPWIIFPALWVVLR